MKMCTSAEQAITCISSGDRIFVHGGAATPTELLEALYERHTFLKDIELIHIHLMGTVPHTAKDFTQSFKAASLFVGENIRGALNYKEIDYLPCFLSQMPNLFRKKVRAVDVALLHLSPPDEQGYCTLGTSVDIAKAAYESASIIIGLINKQMPKVIGDGKIHTGRIDYGVEINRPIYETIEAPSSTIEKRIGSHVASLIENGSTLQIGIGKIPSAVMEELKGHKNLGVHTEVWSDSILPLIKCGAINNSQKVIYPGKIVSSFIIGSKTLYDFIDDNPLIHNCDISFTNNPQIIGQNPKVVAINSALEIDLTGQICADSVGHRIISGVGGQIDFVRGARLSNNGKSIIAIASRTKNGKSKIVSQLQAGAGVVTTRADAHFIVTEYGIADLYGKTLSERAKLLIDIAHPDDRDQLKDQWMSHTLKPL